MHSMRKWGILDMHRKKRQQPLDEERHSREAILRQVSAVEKKTSTTLAESEKLLQKLHALRGAPMLTLMKALAPRMPRLRSIRVQAISIPCLQGPRHCPKATKSVHNSLPMLKVCFTEMGCQSRVAPPLMQLDTAVKALAHKALYLWAKRFTKLRSAKMPVAKDFKYVLRKMTPWSALLTSSAKAPSVSLRVNAPTALKVASFTVTYAASLHREKLRAFKDSTLQQVPAGFVISSLRKRPSTSSVLKKMAPDLDVAGERRQIKHDMRKPRQHKDKQSQKGMTKQERDTANKEMDRIKQEQIGKIQNAEPIAENSSQDQTGMKKEQKRPNQAEEATQMAIITEGIEESTTQCTCTGQGLYGQCALHFSYDSQSWCMVTGCASGRSSVAGVWQYCDPDKELLKRLSISDNWPGKEAKWASKGE
jgi:hypothetical protein